MKLRLFTVYALIGAIAIGGSALMQGSKSGTLKYLQPRSPKGDIVLQMADGEMLITPVTNDIIKISTRPSGIHLQETDSKIVSLHPGDEKVDCHSLLTPDKFELFTPTTHVIVDRKSGAVSFYDAAGKLLLAETGGIDNRSKNSSITFASQPDENFYGAGERGHSLKLNGDTLPMFNRQNYGYTGSDPRIRQMNITIPFWSSSKGYGVLVDDYNKAELILADTVRYNSDTPKPLTYYFINGNGSMTGTTSNYTKLTGRQEMPPFWAMGYITSKYGYHNSRETLGAIDSLKNAGYPVDGIVLDLYWYGTETDMGRLQWDKKQFPDYRGMLDTLHAQGVKLIPISQPYINKKGAIDNYNYLKDKGMLTKDAEGNNHDVTIWVGESGMFDVSNPDTRQWLWNRYKSLTDDGGIDGWWGDLGEPEVHPLTIMHDNGETAAQYHNIYGNEWSRIIYEGWKQAYPGKRPILLMRGGTAGLQKYSVFPWSTDVSRSWGGLEPQVNIMLNSGISGLGYMSSDLGGFAVDPKNPYDPELYVRWVEMGAFTPTFRTHAQYKPEPYHYPQYQKQLLEIVKGRYRWLPYNYTLAYENASNGLPLARPLCFDNTDDRYVDVQDEYLWGDAVLVAPVLTKGARSRSVLFPEGADWVNWHKPSLTYKGGSTARVQAPLGQLPLFIREGSFIPQYMQPIENTDQYDLQYLTVKYFPSSTESSYTLFDDDRKSGDTLDADKHVLTIFTGKSSKQETIIDIDTEGNRDNNWMPASRQLFIEVMQQARPPKSVTLIDRQGNAVAIEKLSPATGRQYGTAGFSGWFYDAATRQINITFPYDNHAASLVLR